MSPHVSPRSTTRSRVSALDRHASFPTHCAPFPQHVYAFPSFLPSPACSRSRYEAEYLDKRVFDRNPVNAPLGLDQESIAHTRLLFIKYFLSSLYSLTIDKQINARDRARIRLALLKRILRESRLGSSRNFRGRVVETFSSRGSDRIRSIVVLNRAFDDDIIARRTLTPRGMRLAAGGVQRTR